MKRNLIILTSILFIIAIVVIAFTSIKSDSNKEILVPLQKEDFEIAVVNSGELEAKTQPQSWDLKDWFLPEYGQ